MYGWMDGWMDGYAPIKAVEDPRKLRRLRVDCYP